MCYFFVNLERPSRRAGWLKDAWTLGLIVSSFSPGLNILISTWTYFSIMCIYCIYMYIYVYVYTYMYLFTFYTPIFFLSWPVVRMKNKTAKTYSALNLVFYPWTILGQLWDGVLPFLLLLFILLLLHLLFLVSVGQKCCGEQQQHQQQDERRQR